MKAVLQEQAAHIAQIVFLGAVLGVAIDMYRVVAVMLNPGKYLSAIYDILFWLGCSLWTFLYLLSSNSGEARLYVLALLLMGFVVEQAILGRPLRRRLRAALKAVFMGISSVIRLLAWVIDAILDILVAPVRLFARILVRPLLWMYGLLVRPVRYGRQRLRSLTQVLSNWWRPPGERPKDY